MAKFVFKNGFFSWNGVDLSDHVETITLNATVEVPESTSMGDSARTRLAGMFDNTVDISFRADYAASEPDVTIVPDMIAGTERAIIIRPDSGVASSTNPQYNLSCLCSNTAPLGGTVGDTAGSTFTFIQSAGTKMTRTT